jgi:hypothetical protein
MYTIIICVFIWWTNIHCKYSYTCNNRTCFGINILWEHPLGHQEMKLLVKIEFFQLMFSSVNVRKDVTSYLNFKLMFFHNIRSRNFI